MTLRAGRLRRRPPLNLTKKSQYHLPPSNRIPGIPDVARPREYVRRPDAAVPSRLAPSYLRSGRRDIPQGTAYVPPRHGIQEAHRLDESGARLPAEPFLYQGDTSRERENQDHPWISRGWSCALHSALISTLPHKQQEDRACWLDPLLSRYCRTIVPYALADDPAPDRVGDGRTAGLFRPLAHPAAAAGQILAADV